MQAYNNLKRGKDKQSKVIKDMEKEISKNYVSKDDHLAKISSLKESHQ
jgi:hypothetical protein